MSSEWRDTIRRELAKCAEDIRHKAGSGAAGKRRSAVVGDFSTSGMAMNKNPGHSPKNPYWCHHSQLTCVGNKMSLVEGQRVDRWELATTQSSRQVW